MAEDAAKTFFESLDRPAIVEAIRRAEARSFGEIRVHLHHGKVADARAEAEKTFLKLGMDKTARGSACLIFIAPASRRFAVVGGTGIHEKVGDGVLARGARRDARPVPRGAFHRRDRGGRREAGRRPRPLLPEGRELRPQRAARRRQRGLREDQERLLRKISEKERDSMRTPALFFGAVALSVSLAGGARAQAPPPARPTPEEAVKFVEAAEKRLLALTVESSRAGWVQANFITQDTEALSALASERLITATAELAKRAEAVPRRRGFARDRAQAREDPTVSGSRRARRPGEERRAHAPRDGPRRGVRARARLPAGRPGLPDVRGGEPADGREPRPEGAPRALEGVARGRDADARRLRALRRARERRARRSSASRTPARCGGASTTCRRTRSRKELDRLWEEVKPLYVALHTYARTKLREKYGDAVPASGPIPAHLLGNMWAQDWTNVYPLLAPKSADTGYDLTKILESRKTDAKGMVKYGEGFFTSLGFAPLPATFWTRSLFTRPKDRDVVCHASAWDVDSDARHPDQDVHRADRRGLRRRPPRARPQLLPARVREAAAALPRERERRLPRGDRRHDRALDHAEVPRRTSASSRRSRRPRGTSASCSTGRSTRSRSCRSAS